MSDCAMYWPLPEHILPVAHLGEYLDRILADHADRLLHAGLVGAQEGVGLLLLAEQARDGRLVAGAGSVDRVAARHELLVVGLDGHGEACVRLGVFVGAVNPHVVGQRAQAIERMPELLGRALEHLAATEGEDGVAAEQCPLLLEGIGDMTGSMAGDEENLGLGLAEAVAVARSEERRVGKGCRWRWS